MSATARRRWSASGALGSIRPCSFSAAAPRYPTSRPSPRGYCHRCHRAGRRGSCSLTRPQHRPARGRRTTLGATSPAMPIQSLGHRRPCAAAAPVSRWRIQCSRCIDAGRHAPHDEARRAQWVQVGGARGLKLREAGVCRRCLVSPINRSFVRSFVSNVVVWKTILYDPAAKLFAVRFWEVITARSPNDNDSLSTAVRAAFEAAKVAVQCADGGQTRRGHRRGRRQDMRRRRASCLRAARSRVWACARPLYTVRRGLRWRVN